MKARQFRQLANKTFAQRLPLLIEGLEALTVNLDRLAADFDLSVHAKAYRAAEMVRNVAREEGGKFLILIDSCRAPDSSPQQLSRQFARAGNHLAKLIYDQIADYSIASQDELLRAVEKHRQQLHLDGPDDYNWILPNELIAERESILYVDLVESEGALGWSYPLEAQEPLGLPKSIRLVDSLRKTGMISPPGLTALQDAWGGFDSAADTHYAEWARRTTEALSATASGHSVDEEWSAAARSVVDIWPMPMVAIDIEMVEVNAAELTERREALTNAWLADQLGWDLDDWDPYPR
ncbi:MAG: AbiV family abortive infection protein [Candidatus Dormibacteraeota bacterium]|nr:AbiV family abortive infection protein [Candidatus Dormibacteraeota bacterium]